MENITPEDQLREESKPLKNIEYVMYAFDLNTEISRYTKQFKGKNIICPFNHKLSLREMPVYDRKKWIATKLPVNQSPIVYYLLKNADILEIESITICGYLTDKNLGIRHDWINYYKYDMVVDTPPLNIFKDAADFYARNEIKFLMPGLQSDIINPVIFNHMKNEKFWLGYHFLRIEVDGVFSNVSPLQKFFKCCWFTNLEVETRYNVFFGSGSTSESINPKGCKCDALYINELDEISTDCGKEMCISPELLKNINPKQFTLVRPCKLSDINKINSEGGGVRVLIRAR